MLPLNDPRWFPYDYDARRDAFMMTRVDQNRLGQASFLDGRAGINAGDSDWVSASTLPALPQKPALLLHTAFCGSTLLARALHVPPVSVTLKEPSVLLSLALQHLKSPEQPSKTNWRSLHVALGLLGRPWTQGGRVLVKPTNQVNRILPHLLAASELPALLLYASLEEFLLSCCKKLPEAETRIRWMAQFLIPGTRIASRLGLPASHAPNFVESCVLTWYAQMEHYAIALAADDADRLRTLDMPTLLARQEDSVNASARWLGLDSALVGLPERLENIFSKDAKNPDRSFDRNEREREKASVRLHFAHVIERALAWASDVVAPAAILPASWKPLL